MTTTTPTPQLRPHIPTCLTSRTPKNGKQQALSQKQVQITFATELANSDVSVYTLMTLLGHESMTSSQRYVTAAGTETRAAAAVAVHRRVLPSIFDD